MLAASPDAPAVYVSAAEAIRRHPGLNHVVLYRLAAVGRVAVDLQPGTPPRYSATDIARASWLPRNEEPDRCIAQANGSSLRLEPMRWTSFQPKPILPNRPTS